MLPPGYQQPHRYFPIYSRRSQRVVDLRPIFHFSAVNRQWKIVHYRYVNELLRLLDAVHYSVEIIRSAFRRERRW